MINLLPPIEKQKLSFEKEQRLATIWGIIVLISLVCLVLILLAMKFYILIETDAQNQALKQTIQEKQTKEATDLAGVIQGYNKTLSRLDSFYKKEIYFNQVFKIITGVPAPKNLYLTDFSLIRENNMVKVKVSGTSDTRDNLILFRDNLEKTELIKNPRFSSDSWINQKNVRFSLTFEVVENGQ